jgi:hypothetical protein
MQAIQPPSNPVLADGKTVHRVRTSGLLSESDGVAVAVKLKVELGLQDVSVALD